MFFFFFFFQAEDGIRDLIVTGVQTCALPISDVRRRPGISGQVRRRSRARGARRSEEHTSELQSRSDLVCRLLLEKKKIKTKQTTQLKKQKKKQQTNKSQKTN